MRERERGFTLMEMLVVIGVVGALFAAVAETFLASKRTNEICESRAADVLGLTRALGALEADGRESTRAETAPSGDVTFLTSRGTVEYRLRAGTLRRVVGGVETALAHEVREFTVAREGPLLRVSVRLARPHLAGKRKAEASTLVAPRAVEVLR